MGSGVWRDRPKTHADVHVHRCLDSQVQLAPLVVLPCGAWRSAHRGPRNLPYRYPSTRQAHFPLCDVERGAMDLQRSHGIDLTLHNAASRRSGWFRSMPLCTAHDARWKNVADVMSVVAQGGGRSRVNRDVGWDTTATRLAVTLVVHHLLVTLAPSTGVSSIPELGPSSVGRADPAPSPRLNCPRARGAEREDTYELRGGRVPIRHWAVK